MKNQATDQKKIFAIHVYRIYREFSKSNSKKSNNPTRKWAKDMSNHFIKEETQMADQHIGRHY